jgi:hypothetical protein
MRPQPVLLNGTRGSGSRRVGCPLRGSPDFSASTRPRRYNRPAY